MAQDPWQTLIQCSQCQSQIDQKEVFLLFAMSIRTLLSMLQKSSTVETGVSVGSYELSGRPKTEVVNMLFREALQSITSALFHLQERARRPGLLSTADPRNSAWDTSSEGLLGNSTESQIQLRHTLVPSTSLGAENIESLLDTLQYTMQAMKQDLKEPM